MNGAPQNGEMRARSEERIELSKLWKDASWFSSGGIWRCAGDEDILLPPIVPERGGSIYISVIRL